MIARRTRTYLRPGTRKAAVALFLGCILFQYFFSNTVLAQEISADFSQSAIKAAPSSGICDGTLEGALLYDVNLKSLRLCRSSEWHVLWNSNTTPATPSFTSGSGAFVLASQKYNGNLGGISGANSKCLTDLTANNWLGKSSLTVDSSTVKAFLCYGSWSNCQNLEPSQLYTFAVSGAPSLGGATFTTDGSGYGPGNQEIWSSRTHFGTGAKEYWGGYRIGSSNSLWGSSNGAGGGSDYICQSTGAWDTASSAVKGAYGRTGLAGIIDSDSDRWRAGQRSCDDELYLICMVNP